jgi:Regulator of chromosome condensation (RCC1) repeat
LVRLVHSLARDPIQERTIMRISYSPFAFVLLTPAMVLGSAACGSAPGASGSTLGLEDGTGAVSATLTLVPTGVQCVKITASPGTTQFVSPGASGWPATVDLGVLQPGRVTVDGAAYDQTCNKIFGHDPTWVADEVTTQVVSGSVTRIPLVFHVNPHSSGTITFAPPVKAMAMGDSGTYALMADGTVRYWGVDILDQKTLHSAPTVLAGVSGATGIAAGLFFGCAILADTTVKCWGASDGTWSLLANGKLTSTGVPPTTIAGLTGVTQLAAAEDHVCALTADRSMYCWGKNTSGELADGTTNDANNAPVKSSLFDGYEIQQIATRGDETAVLLPDGSVEAVGGMHPSVTIMAGVYGAQQIAEGYEHGCAVLVDGTVACWGANDTGQLGDGTTALPVYYRGTPVVGLSDAVQVAAYSSSTCAITRSGEVKCWGDNTRGELGDGHADPIVAKTQPAQITPNLPAVGIATATALPSNTGYNACAVLADQTVRCWGDNSYDQLGDGTDVTRFVPVMPAF